KGTPQIEREIGVAVIGQAAAKADGICHGVPRGTRVGPSLPSRPVAGQAPCRRGKTVAGQLDTKTTDRSDRARTAAATWPKARLSPGRRLTPITSRLWVPLCSRRRIA